MITNLDLAWAAGFLEGEGSFCRSLDRPRLVATQVNREPLDKLSSMFGGSVRGPLKFPSSPRSSPHYRWELVGTKARGVMLTLYVFMSQRRRLQIEKSI